MKKMIVSIMFIFSFIITGCACDTSTLFTNPNDFLGGGGVGEQPSEVSSSELEDTLNQSIDKDDLDNIQNNTSSETASSISSNTISGSGDYVLSGTIENGLVISVGDNETVHLFLDNVTISNTSGIAISNTNKKSTLIITVNEGTTNTITNSGEDVNAIHVKGTLIINGTGTLNVTSNSKNAIKVSKSIKIVDSTINITSSNHGISARTIIASNTTINVLSASKDGLNAECDDEITSFTTDEGYIYLDNVTYTYKGEGDGVQADTYIVIESGSYNITTSATFVAKSTSNMTTYGLTSDDFKYIKSGSNYIRVASDYNGSSTYAMVQSTKGIKVGEIKYEDSDGNEISVTSGDYSLLVNGGTFIINSDDDSLHVNYGNILINGGTFTINTLDDGITADKLLQIKGGTIDIKSCYEGLEGAQIEISGESTHITLVSLDDGINAASDISNDLHIIISGGYVHVNASGDGLDSNGSILISGGTVYVDGPTSSMDASLDSDKGILVNGGYLFAVGPLGMVETPASNSTQYIISFAQSSSIASGTNLTLTDNDGNALFTFTTSKTSQSVIISCPELTSGSTYKIYGGSTLLSSFTISSKITSVGSSTSSSNPGGFVPGGRR